MDPMMMYGYDPYGYGMYGYQNMMQHPGYSTPYGTVNGQLYQHHKSSEGKETGALIGFGTGAAAGTLLAGTAAVASAPLIVPILLVVGLAGVGAMAGSKVGAFFSEYDALRRDAQDGLINGKTGFHDLGHA